MTGPKIGTIDIETSPLESMTWGTFKQNVAVNQIKTEWSILSTCYKPLGGKRKDIEYHDTSAQENPRDDYELCGHLWEVLHDNDILIAQNGKRFDLRKIRARLIMHGFPPPSPVKVIDTMLIAKEVAAFTSNKLEWLADFVGQQGAKDKHKDFPGFELWVECLKGNPKAWAAMKKYNLQDVEACEKVYLKLRPWSIGHPNLAVYHEDDTIHCPCCNSKKLVTDGFAYTQTGKYNRFHCQDCGAWSRDRYTINSKEKRRALLTN